MLEPIMQVLGTQRIVLASSSPRRQEILKNMGLIFDVIPSLYEEDLNPKDFADPASFVTATAVNKVQEVKMRLTAKGESFDVIIGADTMVCLGKEIYGKPKTESEAVKVLHTLNGKCHTVYSGVCLVAKSRTITFSEATNVYFGKLSDQVIEAYVKSGEPMDKAGGYGIQDRGASLIEKVDGDYFNVVGLPLHQLCKQLMLLYQDSNSQSNS